MSDDRSTTDGARGAATTSPPPARSVLLRSLAHRLAGDPAELPVEGRLAPFDGATGWLNSKRLMPVERPTELRFHFAGLLWVESAR